MDSFYFLFSHWSVLHCMLNIVNDSLKRFSIMFSLKNLLKKKSCQAVKLKRITKLGFWICWTVHACSVASVVSDSLWPYGLQPARLLYQWDSLGMNTGVGCCALLQGSFSTQGLNLGLLHCKWICYCWAIR